MLGNKTKNYKTLRQEIEEDTNGKISHVHGLEELILLKCSFYPKPCIDSMQPKFSSVNFFIQFNGIFHRIRKK